MVIDQFIDRTKNRASTFFEKGMVAHIAFGDPVCLSLREYLLAAAAQTEATVHDGGTYVCMEGPAFSTRAESNLYRQWGVDIIGMTACPEVKLAREAELRYATLALSTDYDCWHEEEDDVSVDSVLEILQRNTSNVKRVLKHLIPRLGAMGDEVTSPTCDDALEHAIMTNPELIPESLKEKLAPIIGRYIS